LTFLVSCDIRRITVNLKQGGNMAKEMRPHPGGYKKEVVRKGVCSCCQTNPIAKGNYFLCHWCYTDPYNFEDRVDPYKITEEDACELIVRVTLMERTPPVPVTHFSCDNYSQEQLQAILDGGTP
jgi:hypothetical protein